MSATESVTRQALPTGTWAIDPVHSDIGFRVDYMSGTFRGTFAKITAEMTDGRLEGAAAVSSVQVKDPTLEAHLQSPDFFDAERHPQLRFVSNGVRRSGEQVTVDGEITIKGETRPIELTGAISDPIEDPFGNQRFGLKLDGTLDRRQFGVSWNNPLPTGEPALSNEVDLVADLQFVKGA